MHAAALQRENAELGGQVVALRQHVALLGGDLQGRLALAQVRMG